MNLLVERGYPVTIFDVVVPSIIHQKVHLIQGDITDPVAFSRALQISRAELVFHTASIIDLRPIPSQQMYHVNVEGTRNVVQQCQKSQHCKTLVYTSSFEVVAGILRNGKEQIPNGCDETVSIPEHHFLPYGATKSAAEKLVLEADKEGDTLQTCSIRPSYIVGESCIGHQWSLRMAAQNHNYDVCFKLPVKISCVNPKSAAELHILASMKIKDCHGQSFFARDFDANDAEMKMYAFQDTAVTPLFLPFWLVFAMVWIMDRWERIMHFLFKLCGRTRETSQNVFDVGAIKMTTKDTTVSSEKAKIVLGWRPMMSKRETLEEARESARRYWASLVAHKHCL